MTQRKQYFVERGFQAKFILKFCVIVIIATAVIGSLLFLLTKDSTTVAIENTKVMVKNTSDFLLPMIITTFVLVTIFSALSVGILSLFISHKIAGPLYRLKKEIEKVKGGDLTGSFRIRTGDQFKPLAQALEEMGCSVKEKIKILKEGFDSIYPRLDRSSLGDEEIAKIKGVLDSFKI